VGFVAENSAFAELCERLGVTFIGPSADATRKLGQDRREVAGG
jgi:acetyl/propionyl-CoA carboxylase alpha subunit